VAISTHDCPLNKLLTPPNMFSSVRKGVWFGTWKGHYLSAPAECIPRIAT
jgi:hypothetical protein